MSNTSAAEFNDWMSRQTLEINDDELNIHSGLDTDVGDLPDNISWGVDVEDSLVDSHLPSIVGVRSLTARRFADDKLQELSWHANGSADFQVLAESLVLELKAYFLEGFDFS